MGKPEYGNTQVGGWNLSFFTRDGKHQYVCEVCRKPIYAFGYGPPLPDTVRQHVMDMHTTKAGGTL